MGDSPRSLRSSGLRLLLRLLSAVAALIVLSASSRAAATPLPAVPMCGDHNESVAAPPIFRAADASSLQAIPCQGGEQFGTEPSAPPPPQRAIVWERPERVLPFSALFVPRSESSRVSVPETSFALERPGFAAAPFHPPRS
jgi:hypothetical protein